ncbi:MAG TPA: hypothetical protein VFU97_25110 [Xanthobacteraceae bacterium]|nr:hypothetical protein [Xanthobacteraceae bacterium]
MRLTSEQVERALNQFEAQAIPDDHPMVAQLSELFGDHTFFLDGNGLNVVEPAESSNNSGAATGQVVNLANWGDDKLTTLAPHPPEVTDVVVVLEPTH